MVDRSEDIELLDRSKQAVRLRDGPAQSLILPEMIPKISKCLQRCSLSSVHSLNNIPTREIASHPVPVSPFREGSDMLLCLSLFLYILGRSKLGDR